MTIWYATSHFHLTSYFLFLSSFLKILTIYQYVYKTIYLIFVTSRLPHKNNKYDIITRFHTKNTIPIDRTIIGRGVSGLLLGFIVAGVAVNHYQTSAENAVCGDAVQDIGEQCDDANLVNGDGCSNSCLLEICGNGVLDESDQCDDGNTVSGDGCSQLCQVEFCGDRKVQFTLGEECDDGNGINGDGCTKLCKVEAQSSSSSSSSSVSSTSSSTSSSSASSINSSSSSVASSVQSSTSSSVPDLSDEAKEAQQYLETIPGENLIDALPPEKTAVLDALLQKLIDKVPLTPEEKKDAAELSIQIQTANQLDAQTLTDLLREFIATPISSNVVQEKNLEQSKLIGVEIPIAIDELERSIDVIQQQKLAEKVRENIAYLQQFELDLTKEAPPNYDQILLNNSHPVEVFKVLKSLKEITEKYATLDVSASLVQVQDHVNLLREALPLLQRERGINPTDIEVLLRDIEEKMKLTTPRSVQPLLKSILDLVIALQRAGVITRGELLSFQQSTFHGAATHAGRIAKDLNEVKVFDSPEGIEEFTERLVAIVPAKLKSTFQTGTVDEQKSALVTYLQEDPQVQHLLALAKKDGQTKLVDQFELLLLHIRAVGQDTDTVSTCDDSIPDALACTRETLLNLQDGVRSQGLFRWLIGFLQDLFGIES